MRTLALALSLLALAGCQKAARIDVQPASLRFGLRGQTAKLHATPIAQNGQTVPDQICRWSSTDEKVATVSGPHNDATVTAVGPGTARVRCTIGGLSSEAEVQVRVVSRVAVRPDKVELKLLDEPAPVALEVAAYDEAGAPLQGRVAFTRCASEDVCRGDGRGQLWAVAPGDTTAVVEVDDIRSGDVAVHVVDARTAAGRPKAVRGNPMEALEREVRRREAEERKAAGK